MARIFSLFFILLCSGCSVSSKRAGAPMDTDDQRRKTFGSLLGDDFFSSRRKDKQVSSPPVANQILWRASLETLTFMPLASVDAAGGVIVSDWYITPKNPSERVKVMVYIKDSELKVGAVQVVLTKQILKNGQWTASSVDQKTSDKLETIILKRARDLRVKKS